MKSSSISTGIASAEETSHVQAVSSTYLGLGFVIVGSVTSRKAAQAASGVRPHPHVSCPVSILVT